MKKSISLLLALLLFVSSCTLQKNVVKESYYVEQKEQEVKYEVCKNDDKSIYLIGPFFDLDEEFKVFADRIFTHKIHIVGENLKGEGIIWLLAIGWPIYLITGVSTKIRYKEGEQIEKEELSIKDLKYCDPLTSFNNPLYLNWGECLYEFNAKNYNEKKSFKLLRMKCGKPASPK